MKRSITFIGLFWLGWLPLSAQKLLSLEECYAAAQTHYPLTEQKALLAETSARTIDNLYRNRWLPQLSVNGQATWQSEVTRLPIALPGTDIPVLSKDQYRLTLDAGYLLYDGNRTTLQREQQLANTAVEQGRVEVELYRLKEQVNMFFLNALLADENIRLMRTMLDDLQNQVTKLSSSVQLGAAARMNADELQGEYVRAEQRLAGLLATRRGLREQLALLTGLPIADSTRLELPAQSRSAANLAIARPELKLYEARRSLLDTRLQLTLNALQPRLSLFAQPGVGRPGLNMLSNDFSTFFIGGLRLSWNLSSAYTLHQERQLTRLSRQQVDVEQATFAQNLVLQLRGQRSEIERLEAEEQKDQELVTLRTRVRQAAAVQLENSAIAARDYTSELNAEVQVRLNQKVHELQLVLARIQYRVLTGN